MDRRLFMVAILSLVGPACSNLNRHPESGYAQARPKVIIESESSGPQKTNGTSLNSPERVRLKQLENTLRTNKEVEQYSRALPYMKNETERVEFLDLPDYEARQLWLQNNKFHERNKQVQEQLQPLVESQDIALGMPQVLVKKSWGDPENIEVSGNPQFRNEKWRYSKYVSTPYGYKLERKLVYFEGGKVVGWETE